MANLLRKPFLLSQTPVLSFKRFRGKINIQRPRAPHYDRARVIAVTQPLYPALERVKPCPEVAVVKKRKPTNPYEVILAREVKNWFDHSQMVAVLHINPISGEDFFKARVAFHNEGMQLKKYGNSILKLALDNTKYEALLNISKTSQFSTGFIFSPENKTTTLLKIIKKVPQMHLLCGILEDRLLSKNELTDYSKMPSIDIVRSQFVNVLNMASSQLVQNLTSHQSNLVNVLEAHVRANEKPIEAVASKVEEEEKKPGETFEAVAAKVEEEEKKPEET